MLLKGAPEAVRPLLSRIPDGYDEEYLHHARRGKRVLALASKPVAGADAAALRALPRAEAEGALSFCGFLVLHCPNKPESAEVLRDEPPHRSPGH